MKQLATNEEGDWVIAKMAEKGVLDGVVVEAMTAVDALVPDITYCTSEHPTFESIWPVYCDLPMDHETIIPGSHHFNRETGLFWGGEEK